MLQNVQKPTTRHKGESLTVESTKFGDHITGDHLITGDVHEESIDGDRVALIMKHMLPTFDGFILQQEVMQKTVFWLFDISLHLVKKLESSTLTTPTPLDSHVARWDGDRTLVLLMCRSRMQSPRGISGPFSKGPGLISNKRDSIIPIGVMPHDIGVWHTTYKTIQDHPEIKSPWELRFGEKFKGPNIPFGARIDYWIGPKLKPKKDLRFDPTSNPGVFLGYAIQPGFIWRNEFHVASLKDLMEKDFNEAVQVIRVN